MESRTLKKVIIYVSISIVVISIILASYFDKDNNLRDEAIRMGDSFYCEKIETGFIKAKCFKIVAQKKALLKKCHDQYGISSKECNNLAY